MKTLQDLVDEGMTEEQARGLDPDLVEIVWTHQNGNTIVDGATRDTMKGYKLSALRVKSGKLPDVMGEKTCGNWPPIKGDVWDMGGVNGTVLAIIETLGEHTEYQVNIDGDIGWFIFSAFKKCISRKPQTEDSREEPDVCELKEGDTVSVDGMLYTIADLEKEPGECTALLEEVKEEPQHPTHMTADEWTGDKVLYAECAFANFEDYRKNDFSLPLDEEGKLPELPILRCPDSKNRNIPALDQIHGGGYFVDHGNGRCMPMLSFHKTGQAAIAESNKWMRERFGVSYEGVE